MKIFMIGSLLLAITASYADDVTSSQCKIVNVKTKNVIKTKKFSEGTTCLGLLCLGGGSDAVMKATSKGYSNCVESKTSASGLGTLDSTKTTYICSKIKTVKLSKKERRENVCEQLYNCSLNQLGNTSTILDQMNRLNCDY